MQGRHRGVGSAAGVGGISGTKTDTEHSHEGSFKYIEERKRFQDSVLFAFFRDSTTFKEPLTGERGYLIVLRVSYLVSLPALLLHSDGRS